MSNSRTASLVLNSYAATSTNTGKTSLTWSNINLRTLLGDMFDKYETFNLCLNTIHTGLPPAIFTTTADDANVIMKVSGIPFINNTYNTGTKTNTNSSVICTYQFGTIGASF